LDRRKEITHVPDTYDNGIIRHDNYGNIEYLSHGISFEAMSAALNNYYFPSVNSKVKTRVIPSGLQFSDLEAQVCAKYNSEAVPCMMGIEVDDNNPETENFCHAVTVLSTLRNSNDKYVGIWNGFDFDTDDKKDYTDDDITKEGLLMNNDTLDSAYKAIRFISWSNLNKPDIHIDAVIFNDVQSSNIKEIHTNYKSAKTIDITCVVPVGTKKICCKTWDSNAGEENAIEQNAIVGNTNYANISIDLGSYNSSSEYITFMTCIYAKDENNNILAVSEIVGNSIKNTIKKLKPN